MEARRKQLEACKRKLVALQGWVGDPRIVWQGDVIDGRLRSEAWRELEFPSQPPTYTAPSVRHAARALFYQRHFDRIARLFPELQLHDPHTAALVLMVPADEVKPLLLAYRSVAPGPGIAAARRRRLMPARCVQRLVSTVRRAREEGRNELELSELEKLLRPWL